MPVADTELLFLLNPKDSKHKKALEILEKFRGRLYVPDTALLEFEVVLRSRGRKQTDIKKAFTALKFIFEEYSIKEVKTIDTSLILKHLELSENYGLSYFDSLIAASAISLDGIIVSDDEDFDFIEEVKRIPITKTR